MHRMAEIDPALTEAVMTLSGLWSVYEFDTDGNQVRHSMQKTDPTAGRKD